MSIGCMNRVDKIGEGSYGVVYSATFKDDDNNKLYAVKRNFKELSANWFGNIHEADILIRLKGHPFIVEIHKIALGDPFDKGRAMTPSTADKRRMAEDKMHFILEHAGTCGDSYLRSSNFSYANSKIILSQIAVAIEYMHDRMVIHRDLKPANILMDFKSGIPYSKVCDFGMSCNFERYGEKTPGVVTCWYRSPEICYRHADYDYKSDIWSFGCLMFEFIAKEPWLVSAPDKDEKIMNIILTKLEEPALEEDLNYLLNKANNKFKVNKTDYMKRRLTFKSQLNMRPSQKIEFEKYCGKLSVFIDLMKKCLQINPEKRPTIKEVLEHPFFDYYKNYITNVRQTYIDTNRFNYQVMINKCIERTWVVNFAIDVFSKRTTIYKPWYKHFILFHAINLFERYLNWAFMSDNNRIELRSEESHNQGKLFNKQETEVRFWSCLYLMHKYCSTLEHPAEFKKFCPSHILNFPNLEQACEDFEYQLLKHACNYKIFQETLYEMADKNEKLEEFKISNLLTFYSGIENYIGSLHGLYSRYKEVYRD